MVTVFAEDGSTTLSQSPAAIAVVDSIPLVFIAFSFLVLCSQACTYEKVASINKF
jgi:hypothetical protein